jgi:cytidylate kinase
MASHFVIAIDGPAASGKSSVSKLLSRRLDCSHVNSGALYRATAWGILNAGVDPADSTAVAASARELRFDLVPEGASFTLLVNGVDPGPHLRDAKVAASVSHVASVPVVRDIITGILRSMADGRNLIMEGRDIGTVVFPDTPFKFYIDASEAVRLSRRLAQGETDALLSRDKQDSTRKTAPLKAAGDALLIDSTHASLDEVVAQIMSELAAQGLILEGGPGPS